jgi:hypothetical protein
MLELQDDICLLSMLLASLKEANDDDDHIPLTILLFKGPPLAKPTIVTKL